MAVDKDGKKLPAGITQREDGRYMGRFTFAGERYTLYDGNSKKLKKAMEDMRYELEHGLRGKINNIVLDKWFDVWISEYKQNTVKETSLVLYKDYYTWYIKPVLGKKKVKDIKNVNVQRLINQMAERGFAVNTIDKVRCILVDLMKYAVSNDIILKNPCQNAKLPKTEKKERRVLSVEEQEVFTKAVRGTTYELIYLTALVTGMRIGEILALTWNDIDWKNDNISVNKTLVMLHEKGKKCELKFQTPKTAAGFRSIPVIPELKKMLKEHRVKQARYKMEFQKIWEPKENMENLVFTSQTGKPVVATYLYKNLKYIVKEINKAEEQQAEKGNREPVVFEKISPHTLRHTFATRAFESGMKPKSVQYILGHSSLAMTMDLYTHVTEETKMEEMKKIKWII